jgi:hypothetical protein
VRSDIQCPLRKLNLINARGEINWEIILLFFISKKGQMVG